MRRKRRLSAMVTAVILIITAVPIGVMPVSAENSYTYSGGGIVAEAEDCINSNWTVYNDSGASGGKTARASKNNNAGENITADLTVRFTVTEQAAYSFWIRYKAISGAADSVFYSVDGSEFAANYSFAISDSYNWLCLNSSISSDLTNLSAGEHTISFSPREAGFMLDQIVITKNKFFVPDGICTEVPSGTSLLVSKWDAPPVNPPSEHPRVFFRTSDRDRLKQNFDAEENAIAKAQVMSDVSLNTSVGTAYNETYLSRIESKAYYYALYGDEAAGRKAIDLSLSTISWAPEKTTFPERACGRMILSASMVYDWCYDLLTEEEKQQIIENCVVWATGMEIGWPPAQQGAVVGHGSENQMLRDLMAFAIATYDERPDIWNYIGGRFYAEYVPVRNFTLPGHYNEQGTDYGEWRHMATIYAYALITGMGAPEPYSGKDLSDTGLSAIYFRRPDGTYFSDGDHYSWSTPPYTYRVQCPENMIIMANASNNGYLKNEFYRRVLNYQNGVYSHDYSGYPPLMYLIFNNPDIETQTLSSLPLSKYFDTPAGLMAARTGWDEGTDSNTAAAMLKIGEYNFNNHHHKDCGTFNLFYKGLMATDGGSYTIYSTPEHTMYTSKSVAHNTMLICDPNEPGEGETFANINDGGQGAATSGIEFPTLPDALAGGTNLATTLAHEIDPKNPQEPDYTYIKGDLKNAYFGKASSYERSFMFFNLKDEKDPAALVVFDRVISSNETFKKIWLLHSVAKPEINGNTAVFEDTRSFGKTNYGGRMTVKTLLPLADNLSSDVVGGPEEGFGIVNNWQYNRVTKTWDKTFSKNYSTERPDLNDETNTYRLELSPKTAARENYFLNVILLGDAGEERTVESQLYESGNFYGTTIRDRAVFFAKDKTLQTAFSGSVSGSGDMKYTICGMAPGTYRVTAGGRTQTVCADEDGGVLSFTAPAGSVEISKESDTVTAVIPNVREKEYSEAYLRADKAFIDSCGVIKKTESGFDVPLKAVTKYMGYELKETGSGQFTVLDSDGEKYAAVTSGSMTISTNRGKMTASKAPYVLDGQLMGDMDDWCSLMRCSYSYNDSIKALDLIKKSYGSGDNFFANGYISEDKKTLNIYAHLQAGLDVKSAICSVYDNEEERLVSAGLLTGTGGNYTCALETADRDLTDTDKYTVRIFMLDDLIAPIRSVTVFNTVSPEREVSAADGLTFTPSSIGTAELKDNVYTLKKAKTTSSMATFTTAFGNDRYYFGEPAENGEITYNTTTAGQTEVRGAGYVHYSENIKVNAKSSNAEYLQIYLRMNSSASAVYSMPTVPVGTECKIDIISDMVNNMIYVYTDGELAASVDAASRTYVTGVMHYLRSSTGVMGGEVEIFNPYAAVYPVGTDPETIIDNSKKAIFVRTNQ